MNSPQPLIVGMLFLAFFCLFAIAIPMQPEGGNFEQEHQVGPVRAKRWSPYYGYGGAYGGWGGGYPYSSSYYSHGAGAYPYYSGYWW
ncbi:hypothetical protein GPALN_008042 [Globodera pallida]|nr:hypothetical protein GPALN_008042 [Globodera pallida]